MTYIFMSMFDQTTYMGGQMYLNIHFLEYPVSLTASVGILLYLFFNG